MNQPRSVQVSVDLVRVLKLWCTHFTAVLCQTVFATVRSTERQRFWTLRALGEFWLAVILRASGPRATPYTRRWRAPSRSSPWSRLPPKRSSSGARRSGEPSGQPRSPRWRRASPPSA